MESVFRETFGWIKESRDQEAHLGYITSLRQNYDEGENCVLIDRLIQR